MQIQRKNFPEINSDNEETYLAHLEGVICSVDELSTLQITKTLTGLNFRLAPSLPKYLDLLIQEILKLHNKYGIHLEMSKSIKSTAVLGFSVKML